MATVTKNLGIVSPVPADDWIASTTYQKLNIVSHNDSVYMAKQGSTGIEPGVTTNWQTYWMFLVSSTGGGGSGVEVVQTTGQSTTAVMSQKAVTDELNRRIITGAGAPTTSTVGTVGLLYEDTTNGKLYQCYAVNGSSYIWVKLKQSTWNLIGEYEVEETGIAQWEIQNIGNIIKNFDDINIEIYTPKNTNVSSNLQLSVKFGTNGSYPEAGYLYLAQSSAIGAIPYNYNIFSVLKIKKSGSIITSTLNTNNYGSTSYPSQVYGTVNGKYNSTDLTRLSIATYGDKYTEFPIGTKIKVYWR